MESITMPLNALLVSSMLKPQTRLLAVAGSFPTLATPSFAYICPLSFGPNTPFGGGEGTIGAR